MNYLFILIMKNMYLSASDNQVEQLMQLLRKYENDHLEPSTCTNKINSENFLDDQSINEDNQIEQYLLNFDQSFDMLIENDEIFSTINDKTNSDKGNIPLSLDTNKENIIEACKTKDVDFNLCDTNILTLNIEEDCDYKFNKMIYDKEIPSLLMTEDDGSFINQKINTSLEKSNFLDTEKLKEAQNKIVNFSAVLDTEYNSNLDILNKKNSHLSQEFINKKIFSIREDAEEENKITTNFEIKEQNNTKTKRKGEAIQNKKTKKRKLEENAAESNKKHNFSLKDLQYNEEKTFLNGVRLNKKKKVNLNLYTEIDIINLVNDLENVFPIRFNKIYHHLTSLNFPIKEFILSKNTTNEECNVLFNFFNRYIFNLKLRKTFLKKQGKLRFKFKAPENFNNKMHMIVLEFDKIMKKYTKQVRKVCTKSITKYFKELEYKFFSKNNQILKEKTIFFFETFLTHPRTKILADLFPEIYIFIDVLKKRPVFKFLYKKIHLFLSLLGFKAYLLTENLRHVFDSNSVNPFFVFTDSNFINFYIFEIRCFLCFFGFNFVYDRIINKFLLYKTFISFLRISNIDEFKNAKFDDYISFDEFKNSENCNRIIIEKDRKIIKGKGESKYFKIRSLFNTIFDNYLIHQSETENLGNMFNLHYENVEFDEKVKEITLSIKNYLDQIN
ncbi:hypothetical protein TUBRATIS_000750 [Tubulinosema ratisbonensis]|uniref:Uncharacterized protein n=1 Tax=Tubulinosema ratisbonensis TaxID=291195 RepID=A0A437AQB6_9MICR|nr:hypothetical protein TUBRATIS_000750 [Tubulinosema ratisbonensis]